MCLTTSRNFTHKKTKVTYRVTAKSRSKQGEPLWQAPEPDNFKDDKDRGRIILEETDIYRMGIQGIMLPGQGTTEAQLRT
jgi:hypothetical protein